jgi:hypothetical protein
MKRLLLGIAGLWFAAAPAWAAQLIVWPLEATSQDALVLEVHAAPPCATVNHDAIELLDGGIVRVPFDDGSRVLCTVPNLCPLRIPLGRLPSGQYTVDFVPDRLSLTNASVATFNVYRALVDDSDVDVSRRRLSYRYGRVPDGCR